MSTSIKIWILMHYICLDLDTYYICLDLDTFYIHLDPKIYLLHSFRYQNLANFKLYCTVCIVWYNDNVEILVCSTTNDPKVRTKMSLLLILFLLLLNLKFPQNFAFGLNIHKKIFGPIDHHAKFQIFKLNISRSD